MKKMKSVLKGVGVVIGIVLGVIAIIIIVGTPISFDGKILTIGGEVDIMKGMAILGLICHVIYTVTFIIGVINCIVSKIKSVKSK